MSETSRWWRRSRSLSWEQATPHLDGAREIIDRLQGPMLHHGWLDVRATAGGWQAEIMPHPPRGDRITVGPVCADPTDAARELERYGERKGMRRV